MLRRLEINVLLLLFNNEKLLVVCMTLVWLCLFTINHLHHR